MSAPLIDRTAWTDDDGSGTVGTVINNAAKQEIYDEIDDVVATLYSVTGGGTGVSTLTSHGVVLGAGTGAVHVTAAGATGTVFAGDTGADPVFTTTPLVTSVIFGNVADAAPVGGIRMPNTVDAGLISFSNHAKTAYAAICMYTDDYLEFGGGSQYFAGFRIFTAPDVGLRVWGPHAGIGGSPLATEPLEATVGTNHVLVIGGGNTDATFQDFDLNTGGGFGILCQPAIRMTGNLTRIVSSRDQVWIQADGSARTVTDVYGHYIANLSKGANVTVTNQYGLYVEAVSGAGTINKEIYTPGSIYADTSFVSGANSWIGPTTTTGIYFLNGFVGIGLTNPTKAFNVSRNHDTTAVDIIAVDGSLTGQFGHAYVDNTIVTVSASGGFASFSSAASVTGAGAQDHLIGYQSTNTWNGSTSLANHAGFWSVFHNTGAGAVAQADGYLAQNPTGTGPITVLCGIRVESQTKGTTNWAILTEGTTASKFGGPVTFGSTILDAATTTNVLGILNGASAQEVDIYKTYTSGTNFERLVLANGGSGHLIYGEKGSGGGTARPLSFGTDGTLRWSIGATSGHFLAFADNTYDIGGTAANRPRNVYIGSGIVSGVNASIGGALDSSIQLYLRNGSGTNHGIWLGSALVGTAGANMFGIQVVPSLTTAGSGTHTLIAGIRIQPPTVTSGGATVTNTAALYIDSAFSATVSGANYAVWVAAGTVRLDGLLDIHSGGSTTISTGAGSVKMSTANPANNTAWIPLQYAGSTYYVPAWTTNAP